MLLRIADNLNRFALLHPLKQFPPNVSSIAAIFPMRRLNEALAFQLLPTSYFLGVLRFTRFFFPLVCAISLVPDGRAPGSRVSLLIPGIHSCACPVIVWLTLAGVALFDTLGWTKCHDRTTD
jgi:hypothetical protein